jgi:hypothetical protein
MFDMNVMLVKFDLNQWNQRQFDAPEAQQYISAIYCDIMTTPY